MDKILTIIIPSFNTEKFIDKCLHSLLVEDMDELEIIIVNDGSTDGTSDIAHHYENKYRNTIKVIDKLNGGHGSAINIGLKNADGKYIKVLDGDDFVDFFELKKLILILKNINSDICISYFSTVSEKTGNVKCVSPFYYAEKTKYITPGKEYSTDSILNNICFTIHNVTYRTKFLKEHSSFKMTEKCFYEDNEYNLFAVPFAETIYISDCNVYRYLIDQSSQSVSFENRLKRIDQLFRISLNLIKYYGEYLPNSSSERREYYLHHSTNVIISITKTLLLDGTKDSKAKLKQYYAGIKNSSKLYYSKIKANFICFSVMIFNFAFFSIISKLYRIRANHN